MPDETVAADRDFGQLTQSKVPLDEAADAFALRDANGRIPIVLVPDRLNRIRNDLVTAAIVLALAAFILPSIFSELTWVPLVMAPLALILLLAGVYRSFIVRVPEGTSALLTRGGRYIRTIDPGTSVLPPYIVVSHLVTRREIPFDIPVVDAPTKDNVRSGVDALITFAIIDPYKFVYSISASDFDYVFQASCQDALRTMIRHIPALEVPNLMNQDLDTLRDAIGAQVAAYGVEVRKINIVFAQPPAKFMQSLERRQLAVFQQEEQENQQVLALQRQRDAAALAYQQLVAKIERAKEELRVRQQQAEAERTLFDLEAEAEALRLQRLQERLEAYPAAAAYDVGKAKLEIARALAGNTRAVLQVGEADDIVKAFVLKDVMPSFGEDLGDITTADEGDDSAEVSAESPTTATSSDLQ